MSLNFSGFMHRFADGLSAYNLPLVLRLAGDVDVATLRWSFAQLLHRHESLRTDFESTDEVVKSELATFFQVFPQGVVWGNTKDGQGYDLVLSATNGVARIDIDALTARMDRFDHARVGQSLSDVGYTSALGLLTTYAGTARSLEPWLRGSEINRDKNLRLMFQAGLYLNRYQQFTIYNDILEHSRFPTGLFSGSPGNLALLRSLLGFE